MSPLVHLIIGLVGTTILFHFFGWAVVLFLITTILVDVDHFILYYQKRKQHDIKGLFEYSRNCHQQSLLLFHTIEFLGILLILGFFSKMFYIIFIGALMHVLADTFGTPLEFLKGFNRFPSITLWPLQKRFERKGREFIRNVGICQHPNCYFKDKEILEKHLIDGKYPIVLCPNHHRIVDKEKIKLEEVRRWLSQKKEK